MKKQVPNLDANYDPSAATVILFCPPDSEPQVLINGKGEPKVFGNHKKAQKYAANHVQAGYREHLVFANETPQDR